MATKRLTDLKVAYVLERIEVDALDLVCLSEVRATGGP